MAALTTCLRLHASAVDVLHAVCSALWNITAAEGRVGYKLGVSLTLGVVCFFVTDVVTDCRQQFTGFADVVGILTRYMSNPELVESCCAILANLAATDGTCGENYRESSTTMFSLTVYFPSSDPTQLIPVPRYAVADAAGGSVCVTGEGPQDSQLPRTTAPSCSACSTEHGGLYRYAGYAGLYWVRMLLCLVVVFC